MSAVTFDTHEAIKKLIEAGVPEKQAEAQVKIWRDVASDQLVTQHYVDMRLKELENRTELRLAELKNEIIVKIGGMIVAAVAVLLAFDKLL